MTAGQFIGINCKNTPAVDSQADTDTDIHLIKHFQGQ